MEKEKIDSFDEVVRPLIKWLNDNCHPHMTVIVDSSSAELVEGTRMYRTEDFLKD